MYSLLYKCLFDQKIFGFRKGHSTEHAIAQLVDYIYTSFENSNYTFGILVNLTKAFDTVDHIQKNSRSYIKNLKNCGITGAILARFRSYLTNRKQYVCINNDNKANEQKVTCGVSEGFILGPLLFLIYINDFPSVSSLLNTVMFAEDTNLFFEHKRKHVVFSTVNRDLQNINKCFISNKLSLNVKKRNLQFFIKLLREMIYHLCYQSFLLIIK